MDTSSRVSTRATPAKNKMVNAIGHHGPDAAPGTPAIHESSSITSSGVTSMGLWMVMTHIGRRKLTNTAPTSTIRFIRWKDSLFSRSR